jgi:hypothetical protein
MDSLQFQKAEFADSRPVCAGCKQPIDGSYYQYGARAICAACSEQIRAAQMMPQVSPALGRPLLFGTGAAIACSAGYAVITAVSGLEIALVAILVGYLVGRAVRIGANGAGGTALQVMAVVLTYLAITISAVPLILRQVHSPGQVTQILPLITGLALVSPFMGLTDGVSGILGLLIIGFGLMQAWRQTAARRLLALTGPFSVGQGPGSG